MKDLNRVRKGQSYYRDKSLKFSGSSALEIEAAKQWKTYLEKNRSIIVDLFQGQIMNTIECLSCKKANRNFEPIMYFTLPIPQKKEKVSLEECLKEFSRPEIVSDGWYEL